MQFDAEETDDFHAVFVLNDQRAKAGDTIGALVGALMVYKGAQEQRHGAQKLEPLRPLVE